ncbi:outer membrane protein transport protein [Geomonas sp. Red32]|uniref:OmpP1/FadL family transporter n=1 Tax=Geomonas sp. Red32 TaxID=2912856 RepID=UPI00202CC9BE|nr:outer membrane protein transport protein [Geomonas sp. Red32]MCM0082159.1 outer membrane protein transport protein [Geomonas sp. Red32]
MGKKLVCCAVGAAILATAGLAQAAGLKINEQGAKAMGMANAFVAQADDPTALYYNPAGIAYLKGAQVNMGSLLISVPETKFSGTTALSGSSPVEEEAKKDLFIAPSLYATYSLERIPLTFGLGINSIYPLAKSWDDSSAFRNQVQNIAVKPVNFQPTVAYLFEDWNLAVAAGLDVTHAIVTLSRSVYVPDPTNPGTPAELGIMGLDGTATDFGYNFGLMWKPIKELSFGASYRSEVTLHVDGASNFLATTQAGAAAIGQSANFNSYNSRLRATSKFTSDITLPDDLNLGVAWHPNDAWVVEFDADRTGWSSIDKLLFSFNNTQFNNFNNQPIETKWKDAWCYRLGGQYSYNKNVDLRAGYAYDTNPIPSSSLGPMLPDADRHNVSIGMGLHNDYATLDLAYMWVHWLNRTVANQDAATLTGENGSFKSDAHLFGANVTIKF